MNWNNLHWVICFLLFASLGLSQEESADLTEREEHNYSIPILKQKCFHFQFEDFIRDSLLYYAKLLGEYEISELSELDKAYADLYLISGKRTNSVTDSLLTEELIAFSRSIGSSSLEAFSTYIKARIHYDNSQYKVSNQFILKAIENLEAIEEEYEVSKLVLTSLCYSLISSSELRLGNYEKATEYAIAYEKYANQTQRNDLKYTVFSKFLAIYGDLSSDEKNLVAKEERLKYKKLTEEYLSKSYEFSRKNKMERQQVISSFNMGVFLSNDSQFVKSQRYLDTTITVSKKIDFIVLLLEGYSIKASNFLDLGQLDSALHYSQLAYNTSIDAGISRFRMKSAYALSEKLMEKGRYAEARKYLDEGKRLAEEAEMQVYLIGIYELYAEMNKREARFKEAYLNLRMHDSLEDELMNEDSKLKIQDITEKYQNEVKEQEIQILQAEKDVDSIKLKRKNTILLLIALGSAILFSFLYYYFKSKNRIEQQKAINSKQKLLRAQLNPHFLFNSLNSIQQFIYQKVEPIKIADYLAKFSSLTRRILMNSDEDFVTLDDELDFLTDYLDLQQIRFDIPFDYNIEVGDEIDTDELLIPPMLTQPFVENSIEHGILNKKEKGSINLKYSLKNNILEVLIEDNGIGIEKSMFQKRNTKHRSMATNITRERIKNLGKKFKKTASFEIKDRADANNLITGTQVLIKLPQIYS